MVTLLQNDEIVITEGDFNCSPNLSTYDLDINVSGGSEPFSIDAGGLAIIDNGMGDFVIQNIPAGTSAIINVTDNLNCTASLTTTVYECDCPTIPTPTNPMNAVFCFGESPSAISVDEPSAGLIINWYDAPMNGTLAETGNNFVPAAAGTFYAKTVDEISGCVSERIAVMLTENPAIDFAILNEICETATDEYDLNIEISGGTPPYTLTANTLTVVENSATNFTILQITDAAGVSITITDGENCTLTELAIPILLPEPTVDAGMDAETSCTQSTILLNPTVSNDVTQFAWSGPNSFMSDQQNPVVDAVGIYTLTVTNANGCTASDQLEITTDGSLPIAEVGDDQLITCAMPCVMLSGNSNQTDVVYNWSGPDPDLNPTAQNPMVCVPGIYELTVSINGGTCTSSPVTVMVGDSTDTVAAIIISDPNVNTLNCTIEAIVLSADDSNQNPDVDYSWIFEGSTIGTETITATNPGIYTLVAFDEFTGCEDTETFEVLLDAGFPPIVFESTDQLTCENETIVIDATGSAIGSGITYQWSQIIDIDTTEIVDATELTLGITTMGTYCLTGVDSSNGCVNTD